MNKSSENIFSGLFRLWSAGAAFVLKLFTSQKPETKICKKCGIKKSIYDFYKHKGHKNRIGTCKQCHVERNKFSRQSFLERNPGYNSEMNKKYRQRKTELARMYAKKASKGN